MLSNREVEDYIVKLSKQLKSGETVMAGESTDSEKEFERETRESLIYMQRMEE